MLYVIATGGKQYLVKSGQVLKVEKLDVVEGEKVSFDKVLLSADDDGQNANIGKPYLDGVTVEAVLEKQVRDKKIRVEKYKRKTRFHKVYGHRQPHSQVKIV